jgi:hypothetical protein
MKSWYDIVLHKSLGGFYGLHEVFRVGKRDVVDELPIVVGDTPHEILQRLHDMVRGATASCARHLDGAKGLDVE